MVMIMKVLKFLKFFLTPSAGKRLIAKALIAKLEVQKAIMEHTVVIVAGTTNSYLAEEALNFISDVDGFDHRGFFRGIVKPAHFTPASKVEFIGDVVIEKGKWLRGKTIHDVGESLTKDDIIFKGANVINLTSYEAAVIIGNPKAGTMADIISAVIGRRVRLIHPVGVEKRVDSSISALIRKCDAPESLGFRLCPTPGIIFTEFDAIRELAGAETEIMAGGGVCGDEGGCYFVSQGTSEQLVEISRLVNEISVTPPFVY